MPHDARVMVSYPALRFLKDNFGSSWGPGFTVGNTRTKDIQNLQDEVEAGKCNLRIESGRVLRVVRVVVLKLLRQGELCVQIGKSRLGTVTPSVELPGTKMQMLETHVDSVERLLQERLPEGFHMSISDREISVEERSSAAYGIPTRYVRNIVTAHMESDVSSSIHLQTKRIQWGTGHIEVFAVPETNREDSFNAFAWMSENQFATLTSMGDGNIHIIQEWFDEAQTTSSVNARTLRTSECFVDL